MIAALRLQKMGIHVRIIDQEERTTTHSYASVLHPATLRLLAQWDMSDDVFSDGRRIETVAFYDETQRRAELSLRDLGGDFRCALILPQSRLEQAIERRLASRGVKIDWGHRLSELHPNEEKLMAHIDHLRQSGKGYIVPDFDWEIASSLDVTADFIIGADGYHSQVRRCLESSMNAIGPRRTFAMYEFETDAELENEIHVVLGAETSVLWPLPDNRCRWSFELTGEELEEFPVKERSRLVAEDLAVDRQKRDTLRELLERRAPWFKGSVNEIHWTPTVQFEPSLASSFGEGRCWLIGDAAHQAAPAGVQSMNIGLREAGDLTECLGKIIRDGASLNLLEAFAVERREEWQRLLQPDGVKTGLEVDPWIRDHAQNILSCLPASGNDLTALLGQVQLELSELHPV